MARKKIKKIDRRKRNEIRNPKKTKGKKAQSFTGKNIDKETAKSGIQMETSSVLQKTIFFLVIAIMGFVLCIMDIRDSGMTFEGLGIKYNCTMIGGVMVIIGIIGMIRNHPNVTINNDSSESET